MILFILITIRLVFNGLDFLDSLSFRSLLFTFLYTIAALGVLFSKKWDYLLTGGVAVSELSIISVESPGMIVDLGSFATVAVILVLSIFEFYRFEQVAPRKIRRGRHGRRKKARR